jgi:hypothetical protein
VLNWVDNEHIYSSHRRGWRVVKDFVADLHNPQGINCFSWADRTLKTEHVLCNRWCGFLHNVIYYPDEYPLKYHDKIYCLKSLIEQPWFHESLCHCVGLWTLCNHTTDYLRKHVDVKVENIWHPCIDPGIRWRGSSNSVIAIGQWMRRFHSLPNMHLPSKFRKVILKVAGHESDYEEMRLYCDSDASYEFWGRLTDTQYDLALSTSIVFLDLYDVAACNVILECMMANTPLVVRRLPAAEEYLGVEYPLFFDSLEEASEKIQDQSKILDGNHYLRNYDKSRFTLSAFSKALTSSSIYKGSFRQLL